MKRIFIIFDIEMDWSQIKRIIKTIKDALISYEKEEPPKTPLDEYKEKLKKALKVDVKIEDSELEGTTIKIPGPGILIPLIGTKLKNIFNNKNNNDQLDPIVKELLKEPEKSEIETISLAEIIEEYKEKK